MEKRLQYLLSVKDLTPAKLAEILDIQPSAISHLLSGRNKPSYDVISRFLEQFPDLNPRWFMLGVGAPFLKPAHPTLDFMPNPRVIEVNATQGSNKLEEQAIEDGGNILTESSIQVDSIPERDEAVEITNVADRTAPQTVEHRNKFPTQKTTNQNTDPQVGSSDRIDGDNNIERVVLFFKDGTFKSYNP